MKSIHLAPKLTLPLDAVTQTFAILGVRGSGKTNTGVVLVEELLTQNQQVVVIDPVDVWWGIKSSKDGKSAGFRVPIIGGEHADVPLDAASGSLIADFVADNRASVILALRHLSMNDQRRFATEFAKRLYDRKGPAEFRSPMMLVVDEADEFVPQRIPSGHEPMFGAFDRIVRRGRSSGLGVTLISQRPQVINKDVLSQMETLVAMRVLHKLDRAALDAWIEAHDTEGRREEFMASLASLDRGDAWVWSPSWLGVFQRVHIRERNTFDSSATPKAGVQVAPPKQIAHVDLEKLRASMAETLEKAKADDPRELRRQIAELQKQLRTKTPAPLVQGTDKTALKAEYERGAASERSRLLKQFEKAFIHARAKWNRIRQAIEDEPWAEFSTVLDPSKQPAIATPAPVQVMPARVERAPQRRATEADGSLTGPEQRILDALAWLESIGIERPEQTAVAFLAGYTIGGGAWNNPRGALRTKGLIEYSGDALLLTDGGRSFARFPDVALTTEELQRRVLERLPGPESRILRVLIDAYPKGLANDELARAAGYEPGGGAYNNPRGRLRSLGLIEYRAGEVIARPVLFLEGR